MNMCLAYITMCYASYEGYEKMQAMAFVFKEY